MMSTDLETRLRAAGDQMDQQIASRTADWFVPPARRPVWTLAVAACAGALLMAGLVWLTNDDSPVTPAAPATTLTEVVVPTVTVAPTIADTVPATTGPAANTSTVPVEDRPAIAVGESVMLGAKPQLEAGGFSVYAEESHQVDWIIRVVGQLHAANEIGRTIVIQVGTNGQVTAADYDEIMSFLPAAEVPRVVFLTVRATNRQWIDGNNELIRALPQRYPDQVVVLEWKGLVDSDQIPGMAGDGAHLGLNAAKQTYANYIFDTIGRRDLVLPVE